MSTLLPEMALSFGFSRKRRRETPIVATELEPDPRQALIDLRRAEAAEALVPFVDVLLVVGAPPDEVIGPKNARFRWVRKLTQLVLDESRLVQGEEPLLVQPISTVTSPTSANRTSSVFCDEMPMFSRDHSVRRLDEVRLDIDPSQSAIERGTIAINGITAALHDAPEGHVLAFADQRLIDDISALGDVHGHAARTEGSVSGLVLRGAHHEVSRWSMISVK